MKTLAYIFRCWGNQTHRLEGEPVTVCEAIDHCARIAGDLMPDERLEVRDEDDGTVLFHTNKMQHDMVMQGWDMKP